MEVAKGLVKFFPVHAMLNTLGVHVQLSLYPFLALALDVNDNLHYPDALPPGTKAETRSTEGWVNPESVSPFLRRGFSVLPVFEPRTDHPVAYSL